MYSVYQRRPAIQRVLDVCKHPLGALRGATFCLRPFFSTREPTVPNCKIDVEGIQRSTLQGWKEAGGKGALKGDDEYMGTMRVIPESGVGSTAAVPLCNMVLATNTAAGDDAAEGDKKDRSRLSMPCTMVAGPEGCTV